LSWKLLIFFTVVFIGALFNAFTASINAFLPVSNERLCWMYESFNNNVIKFISPVENVFIRDLAFSMLEFMFFLFF
jgi:hypothetical protein